MNDKSIVSIGQHQCPICGELHDSGEILLQNKYDREHTPKLDKKTTTNISLCPEHLKLHEDGYIAFVAALNPSSERIKLHEADRTGEVAHLKRDVARKILDMPEEHIALEMIFVDPEVINILRKMQAPEESTDEE